MNLYYNTTAQCRVDEFNTRVVAKPVIHYGACPTWVLHFFSGDTSETPEPVDLSNIVSWRAAVDSDWNSSTEPMCRTLAADIDSSRKAQGIISVPVNANTQRYLTVVNGKQSVAAWFELRGFNAQGNVELVVLINIICSNSIDPDGGAEPQPVDNDTASMTWVSALVNPLADRVAALEAAVGDFESDAMAVIGNFVNEAMAVIGESEGE